MPRSTDIDSDPTSRHRGITLRSFVAGLVGVVFVTAYTPYNDYVLGNTFFVGNHLPIGIILLICIMVLGGNSIVRYYWRGAHLSASELIVVYTMMMTSAGFATAGLHRYWANGLALPFHITDTVRPTWAEVMSHLDTRLFPSVDPTSEIIDKFANGGAYFFRERSLWMPWARAMGTWAIFLVPLFLGLFCVCIIVRQQWVHNESLTFPLAQFAMELVRDPEPGHVVNRFLRNRMTWLGVAIPALILGLHGLHQYYPQVPEIKLSWRLHGLFRERPWNLMSHALYNSQLYLSMVAIAIVIPSDVSFSIWFFFVAVSVVNGLLLWAGQPLRSETRIAEHMGGYLMLMVMLVYIGRSYFLQVASAAGNLLRFRSPKKNREQAVALLCLVLCCVVCWLWLWHFGMGPVWSLMLVFMLLAMNIVAGRVISEAGITLFQHRWWPIHAVLSIIGIRVVGVQAAMVIAMVTLIAGHDLRECLLPYLLNNTRIVEESAHIQRRRYLGAVLASIFVSIVLGAVVHLGIDYYWGPKRHEHWALFNSFNSIIGSVVAHEKQPLPVTRNLFHFAGGAGFVAFLSLMRVRFTWWHFHPVGFVMAHTWPASIMWASIFLGWAIKLLVMRYGGSKVYYRLKPLFYGVVLGECLIGGVWMVVTAMVFLAGREPHRIVLLPL